MAVTTIEMNTEYQLANRFPSWLALMVFNVICLVSLVAQTKDADRTTEEKWAMAIVILSMIFSFASVCCYLFMRGLFIAQVPEVVAVSSYMTVWVSMMGSYNASC